MAPFRLHWIALVILFVFLFTSTGIYFAVRGTEGRAYTTIDRFKSEGKLRTYGPEPLNQTKRLCYVTSFLDIKRSEWQHFQRSVDTYFQGFYRFFNMFFDHPDGSDYDLVIFLDKLYLNRLPSNVPPHIHIQPIDEAYLRTNSPLWQRFDREKAVMESEAYQALIRHRIHHPEHSNPRYTLINHCKIDLVERAARMVPDATHFAWVDFGYCSDPVNVPHGFIDVEKLGDTRVSYILVNPIDPVADKDITNTLVYAPEKVDGGFFAGSKESLLSYRKLYHNVHQRLQNENIVDDDQHIALLCYFEEPDLFSMHNLGHWHVALKTFQND